MGAVACSSDDGAGSSSTSGGATTTSGDGGDVSAEAAGPAEGGELAGLCPDPVVVQDSWYPQVEVGFLFQTVIDDYTVDTGQKSVSGPLKAGGVDTGVTMEIRAGGPAVGYQSSTTQMYSDDAITLAKVDFDQGIDNQAEVPTLSVFAQLDRLPFMVMWDPATYPEVETIAQLGPALEANGGVYRYTESNSTYVSYLVASGQLPESVLDASYDGTPANFVAAAGKDAQQGYTTNEPYLYEHEIASWGKPVKYQLLADAGWELYGTLAIRSGEKETLAPCLAKLIPILQQAQIDYMADPGPVNDLILDLVDQYQSGAIYTLGVMEAANVVMTEQALVSNGSNSTLGDFDDARVQAFFDLAVPIMQETGHTIADDLDPKTIYTNEFIDMSIGLP
jgi:hypothetical protein